MAGSRLSSLSSISFGRGLATSAFLALLTSTAGAHAAAQPARPSAPPLHLPTNRFDFTASGDANAPVMPLRIHNGSAAPFSGVQLTRLVYADSSRGASWLVAVSRQTEVGPNELATIGTLCVNPARVSAGT